MANFKKTKPNTSLLHTQLTDIDIYSKEGEEGSRELRNKQIRSQAKRAHCTKSTLLTKRAIKTNWSHP